MPFNYKKRCAICQSTNKQKKQTVCDECSFVNEFVVKWGRENLRFILHNYIIENSLNSKTIREEKNKRIDVNECSTNVKIGCGNTSCSCHTRKSFSGNCTYAIQPCAPPYKSNA